MPISWTADLDTGIPLIDQQHRRIVDFINHLEVAKNAGDKEAVKQIVYDCVDYTLSHFAFEESLQEEAGYAYCKPHKKVHELFARKVSEYQERMDLGDDVAEELHATLARWLVNHIKRDDADYVESVRASMAPGARALAEEKKKTGWFRRLFGR
ncbi:bacteriohemerythrin [Azonexus hydrophilus]